MLKNLARVSFRTVSIKDCDCGATGCETKVVTGFLEVILFFDRVCFAVESKVLGQGDPEELRTIRVLLLETFLIFDGELK